MYYSENDLGLKINGKKIPQGKNFRFGYNRKLERTDLIVWLKTESAKPITIEIVPVYFSKNRLD